MTTISAGLLLHRQREDAQEVEVLLGHMGGPFFARKDDGGWSIPKGIIEPGEDPLAGAVREFTEEMGSPPPDGPAIPLGSVRARGKTITVFAVEGDFDASSIKSNEFELEWPPRSGRIQSFPEIDRAAWFDTTTARRKLTAAQVTFVDRLLEALAEQG
ncbi:Predicted NTP pyrophosphohydrolase, NUDIX family [Pseudonocardia thermophila]|uniref:Predicted NTP pyrophosphohydrolase, NUDIX family n=1 Tax=Pseudonocardia thermophila TaxID=1848 RepID=A0A1M6NMK9_PSETH|nr:NUDIX domain-containing protein [Pseudonocardia thermophila]SHJ96971.1 Predicted NTP pyrophosphohydrolase, NUDIX family [Pseudonocardia thermophila]